jgi:hypothetical protein
LKGCGFGKHVAGRHQAQGFLLVGDGTEEGFDPRSPFKPPVAEKLRVKRTDNQRLNFQPGILKALGEGLEGKFVENLDYSIKNNETFDRFGGHTAKGRYHWELPWPKRDLKKSKEELQKSIDKHPEHLRNYLFLAETLLKDGDAKAAKVQVDKVLNGDAAYDPPESRRVKGWAKDVAAQIDKELN